MNERATEKRKFDEEFIKHLEGFIKRKDRAALAHLRRGLGKEPGTAMEMFSYIPWWITNQYNEKTYFLIATLFGLHPTKTNDKENRFNNLGNSLSKIKDSDGGGVEKRFIALLNSSEDDLPEHLRQIIGLLKSKEVNINWLQLVRDVKYWSHEKRYVQKQWARGFWGNKNTKKEKGEEN